MQGEETPRRSDKELLRASNAFAQEVRWLSWWHLLSTLTFLGAAIALAAAGPHWALRLLGSVLAGLMIVRTFILYHDFKHGSILRGSKLATLVLDTFGVLCLTPPNVWTQTHNYHHAHTAKLVGSHVGSFRMVSTGLWEKASPSERRMYKLIRSPLNILFGYFTVFFYDMCISAFLRNPSKNWDSAFAGVVQIALAVTIGWLWGLEVLLLAFLLPQFISHAMGAYLFYAQHNFPDAYVQAREEWSFVRAALESSSYMELGPVMRYFTGNIGYHHVHHLNYRIPFYRLPEAMAAIPELQSPRGVTNLSPGEIMRCLQLKVWDPDQRKLGGYPAS